MTNVMTHHRQIRQELAARYSIGTRYLKLLETELGINLDRTLISAAEHSAPFNTADTVSFLLPQFVLNHVDADEKRDILLLTGGLVPLDNRQYPRGFVLPGSENHTKRLNLFTKKERKTCAILQPAVRCHETEPQIRSFLQAYPWLKNELTNPLDGETYASQICRCMEIIANRWGINHLDSRLTIRPLEDLARILLIRLLCENDPVIESLLFDQYSRSRVAEELQGVFCAWGRQHGSFLFWAATEKHKVERLHEDNGCLIGDSHKIPLTRDDLLRELEAKQIWPGIFLSLLVVSFMPCLPVAGGPKQLTYYRSMIRTANRLVRVARSERLSVYGYMCVKPQTLLPVSGGPFLRAWGTGLDITERNIDIPYLAQQMDNILVPDPLCPPPLPYD